MTQQVSSQDYGFPDIASMPDINQEEIAQSLPDIGLPKNKIDLVDLSGLSMNRASKFEAEKLEMKRRFDRAKKKEESGLKQSNPMEYSGDQMKAAAFANRMLTSSEMINDLMLKDSNANKAQTGFTGGVSGALTALPLGDAGAGLGQAIVKTVASTEQKRYLNAAENWIRANLRRESGAVIGADEMRNEYATYFPTPTDDQQTIKQKRQLREQTEKGMIAQSAGAYELSFDENKKKPKLTKEQAIQMLKERGRL